MGAEHDSRTASVWNYSRSINRWQQIWLTHLELQMEANPGHPGHVLRVSPITGKECNALDAYRAVVGQLAMAGGDEYNLLRYIRDQQKHEVMTRHDLVAGLRTFNDWAGRDEAHHGLTSSDVTEVAQQMAVLDCCQIIRELVKTQLQLLRYEMTTYRDLRIVGRTHGQPAQLTTLGMRYASVAHSLVQWLWQFDDQVAQYAMRPPGGAVGTAADLVRVLGLELGQASPSEQQPSLSHDPASIVARVQDARSDWTALSRYVSKLSARLGFSKTGSISRQTYERVQDLSLAGLMVALAMIARGWATDRRLEALLGAGTESGPDTQVGSSAMAQKRNPAQSERVVALSSQISGHYVSWLSGMGNEWFEGDVSTSALRKRFWPTLFWDIEDLLVTWNLAGTIWISDEKAIELDVARHWLPVRSALWLQRLVDAGHGRTEAHEMIRQALRQNKPHDQAFVEVANAAINEDPGIGWCGEVIDEIALMIDSVLHTEVPECATT